MFSPDDWQIVEDIRIHSAPNSPAVVVENAPMVEVVAQEVVQPPAPPVPVFLPQFFAARPQTPIVLQYQWQPPHMQQPIPQPPIQQAPAVRPPSAPPSPSKPVAPAVDRNKLTDAIAVRASFR